MFMEKKNMEAIKKGVKRKKNLKIHGCFLLFSSAPVKLTPWVALTDGGQGQSTAGSRVEVEMHLGPSKFAKNKNFCCKETAEVFFAFKWNAFSLPRKRIFGKNGQVQWAFRELVI